MAKELVDLSNKNDDLEEKVKDLPLLQSQHKVYSFSDTVVWVQYYPKCIGI